MVTSYFFFAHNVSKKGVDVYYKMGLVVLYKAIWQALNANGQAVLKMLCERVNVKPFLLSYDNMNFYRKVQDQRVDNKNYQVVYIAGYVFFMKGPRLFLCYTVKYEAVNKLKPKDFLFALTKFQYQTKAIRYYLS